MVTDLKSIDSPAAVDKSRLNTFKLDLIVPFYNERRTLPHLLAAVDELARRLRTQSVRLEVILVDDGSRDEGGRVIAEWAAANAPAFAIRLIRLSRNFGKELALSAGLDAADGDAITMMDADLQHPAEVVDTFVEAWLGEGYDMVYAYREQSAEGLGKRLARASYYRLINASLDVDPHAGDFRLMSRRAYEALRLFSERERLMKGLYGLIGFRTKGVPYAPPERPHGASKFSPIALFGMGLNGITSFSVLPLRLTMIMGLALGVLAFGYGLWTIFEKLVLGINVPGYPTLIVIISTIGAAQLVGIGIVGEYVGKVLIEVKRRPLYITESDERLATAASPHPAVREPADSL
jgi:glycosyltransferase involved in cell wall biosynthesis